MTVLRKHCTESCIEEFVCVGGLRVLLLWWRRCEQDATTKERSKPVLRELIRLCKRLPINNKTREFFVKNSDLGKKVKTYSKKDGDLKDLASDCMKEWLSMMKAINEQNTSPIQQGENSKEPPPIISDVTEIEKLIADRRNECITKR